MIDLEDLRFVGMAAARFGTFASHALVLGIPLILLLVLRPTFAGLGETWRKGRGRVALRMEGVLQAALIGAFISTAITIVLQATVIAELRQEDLGTSSFMSVFESGYGRWYLLRLPLLVAAFVLLPGRVGQWSLMGTDETETPPARAWWTVWILMGIGLMATITFSGHAPVAVPQAGAEINDLIHLVTGAIWFAGIVVLATILPDGWRGKEASERLFLLGPAVLRFSRVALVSILLVGITGTINTWLHLEAFNDLFDTPYGRSIALKILLFLMILALGGVNHFWLRDRMLPGKERSDAKAAQRLFRRTVGTELVVAVAIVALTGVLVGQSRTKVNDTRPQEVISRRSP